MKNSNFYTEEKHKETMNSVDMLKGSINRMCVTDDLKELRQALTYAMCRLAELYVINRDKIIERKEEECNEN